MNFMEVKRDWKLICMLVTKGELSEDLITIGAEYVPKVIYIAL